MPKLRLINPRNPLNGLVQSDLARRLTFGRKAVFMPLGLMVAATTVPRSWQVEIVDECVQGVPVAKDVDLVGITAMTCQAPRAYEIADAYRQIGVPVILGGILQEISELGAKRVVFADDNMFGDFRWAKKFLKELAKLRIQWAGQAPLSIARDREMLALLKDSGCTGVILGLESPNPASLRESNKTVCPAEDYLPLIRRLQAARITTWGSFVLGFDADTVESLHAAVRFAREAELDISSYPILTPYPGTPLFAEYEAAGRLLTRDWVKYTGGTVVFQPKQMTPRELANCQVAAFGEFYSWRSMWQRLTLWPLQKWTWIINISINQGFRYYYRRQKKRMPDFQDAPTWATEAATGYGAAGAGSERLS
jgi:radical SAM superfamily enzyme YgiQ (UPF0313 family)